MLMIIGKRIDQTPAMEDVEKEIKRSFSTEKMKNIASSN